MNCIRIYDIRQRFGVAPIADKLREARLRWYGHVLRGEADGVRKIGLKQEKQCLLDRLDGARSKLFRHVAHGRKSN